MRLLWALGAVIFNTGCIPSNAEIQSAGEVRLRSTTQSGHDEYLRLKTEWDLESKRLLTTLSQNLIHSRCEGPNTPQCGLVVEAMMARYDRFVEATCLNTDPYLCSVMYRLDIIAAIQARYNTLDTPLLSEDLGVFESRELREHNDRVYALYAKNNQDLTRLYRTQMLSILADTEDQADQIRTEVAEEMRKAERSREVLRAVILALAAGAKAYSNSYRNNNANTDTPVLDCRSDYQCNYGHHCVKSPGRTRGYCARTVDRNGTPTHQAPRPESVHPGEASCFRDTSCPFNFQCIQGQCMRATSGY